ncbi:hypothetical protein [Halalkalibacter urbisdiaboli]|uniref:hypothetical protein n=1 Tax=Halalkalibacter urbisdiaboli TaxID=1960589 RepID=UPI000B439195|nr:hypothetical protein [Halalkalibacter urbisdiaboli]
MLKHFLLNRLHFLTLPELHLSTKEKGEFDSLYDSYVKNGQGETIIYQSSLPKYMFLNYLIENKNVLVHGSQNDEIAQFEPREQTLFTGKLVKAVFASSDSVWSMFFALVNKQDYVGSLRNACFTAQTKKGLKRYYYFSLNRAYKGEYWAPGTIYLFPRKDFEQGGVANEWICKHKISPLARIKITEEDFPFMNDISRHLESDSLFKTLWNVLVLNKRNADK